MARRRKQGAADDLMDLVAMLPWWAGVALAMGSYLLLHSIASAPMPPMTTSQQISGAISTMLIRAFATAGQYVLPLLCLLGAFVSFMRRRKRTALLDKTTASPSANALNDMSWQEFELLVGEGFRRQGFEVTELGGPQADGGVDLVLRKGTETHLVQCKQWKAYKVGVDTVRQLYGVMAARGAAGGYVITSGDFTSDARAFADGRNITLIDGSRLFAMIKQAKEGGAPKGGAKPKVSAARPAPAQTNAMPSCPKCAKPMVRRTAKTGVNAGKEFWGCSTFPACRGTR